MKESVERSAEWIYRGVWRVLSDGFRVPQLPPAIPSGSSDFCRSFHPSRKYLSYLKIYFWIGLVAIDVALLIVWIGITIWQPLIGAILALPMFIVAVVPDIIAYVAIHLRYDTMWYVMTDRSLRTRRGIWVIKEHTITFENVQNVYLHRGPVQQLFGISTIVVETAGSESDSENPLDVGNRTIMEGLENAGEIRDLIMERVRSTRTVGLGDERDSAPPDGWQPQHLDVLREIRDEVRLLV